MFFEVKQSNRKRTIKHVSLSKTVSSKIEKPIKHVFEVKL